MKVFILLDNQNIVRCIASEENNLHEDKLYMRKFYVEMQGIVGDEYNPEIDSWISRPKNHPELTDDDLREELVGLQIRFDAMKSNPDIDFPEKTIIALRITEIRKKLKKK